MKRTPLTEYPLQGRYGKGVVALPAKYLAQTGKLVAARVVDESDDVGLATSSGATVRVRAGAVGVAGRALRGSPMPGLRASERVIAMVSVAGRAAAEGEVPVKNPKPKSAPRAKKAAAGRSSPKRATKKLQALASKSKRRAR
jgi:DNA gyrase subunit A